MLGDNWENWVYKSGEEKTNKKTGEIKSIEYSAEDLWHVCFSFDEPEYVEEFAKKKLHFDDSQTKQLVRIYGAIQQGYGMLSLKATKNINRFLQKGLIYTDAVLLAKLPDIFKKKWADVEEHITSQIDEIIKTNREQKLLYNIANSLIADYKSLEPDDQFAFKNCKYKLVDSDLRDVKRTTIATIGEKTWAKKDNTEQEQILAEVARLYQEFFASEERDYFKLPKVTDALAAFLHNAYKIMSEDELRKEIYHPSMIEFYAPAKDSQIEDGRWLKLLGSPVIGALKNPMAMRVLHILRRQINAMLKEVDENGNALIDENTRIVIETARELNDANMRWAIESYQREREAENKEYAKIIKEHFPNREIDDVDIDQARLICEQHDMIETSHTPSNTKEKRVLKAKDLEYKKDITKYRLWLEQGCRCLYTGKIINITNLFDDNAFDIEHTIPRSQSFDDSLANLTICDAHFNRTVKKNQIPTQLTNYEEIKLRLQPWFDKVEQLRDNVEFWKAQSKRAQDKEKKDKYIRQRHLWQMELDYWQNKVNRFTMTEVTSGFRNSQLVDTRIITKYAYHYLKTVFNKVEVQKGSVTANFRKMLGIQSIDEKKSREKHSHHAIDATMLTLVPTAAKRDKMLELFYKIQEKKKLNEDTTYLEKELEREKKGCGLTGNISDIVPYIENNILVNHITKDQTLTPAKRKARIRGKEVYLKNKNGELANKWITGDCIRGQLHGDTFYGAIELNNTRHYVVRRDLKYKRNDQDKGFKNWDELEKSIVDKDLFKIIKGQFPENTSFKEACENGIYMFKKNDKGIIDYSDDCKVNKIRHIRCHTSVKNPLSIKKQTYLSGTPYKQNFYAEIGDLYMMCKYENEEKTEKEYRIWSLFDISQNREIGIDDIPQSIISNKKNKLQLTQHITAGDMILIYKDTPEELIDMDMDALSQRLYVVRGFENDGNRIVLQKNTNALSVTDLGKGESIKDYHNMPEKIRCGVNTIKFLLKDVDFVLSAKGIKFKNL